MNELQAPKRFYVCDPVKNIRCRGRFGPRCQIECYCTTDPRLSTNGKALTGLEYALEGMKRRMELKGGKNEDEAAIGLRVQDEIQSEERNHNRGRNREN